MPDAAPAAPRRTSRGHTATFALAILILLAAALLRTAHGTDWPPGLSYDEGTNGIDAYRFATTGVLPVMVVDGRPEPMYRALAAINVGLIGPSVFALRFTSLVIGLLTVAAAYRAGRHMIPRGAGFDRGWAGLLAAGVLAVMVGHIQISRVAYRGVLLPLFVLLAFDALMAALDGNRRRDFVLAGVWLGGVAMSYTSGLVVPPVTAALIALLAVARPRALAGRWRGLLWMAGAFAVAVIPQAIIVAVQPNTYARAAQFSPEADQVRAYARNFLGALSSLYRKGDLNPQYNVAGAPLLDTPLLIGVFALGVGGCLIRPRRAASLYSAALLIALLLPAAVSDEVHHGLRLAGEYAAVPLVAAASLNLLGWLRGVVRASLRPALLGVAGGLLAVALIGAGLRGWQIYETYFTTEQNWGGSGNMFSWFFETKRQAMANVIAERTQVVYVPLVEAEHPSMRFFTLRSHPRVVTFSAYFGPGALTLSPGRFLIPPGDERAADFAAYMPDGTIVILPRFDADTLAADHRRSRGQPDPPAGRQRYAGGQRLRLPGQRPDVYARSARRAPLRCQLCRAGEPGRLGCAAGAAGAHQVGRGHDVLRAGQPAAL